MVKGRDARDLERRAWKTGWAEGWGCSLLSCDCAGGENACAVLALKQEEQQPLFAGCLPRGRISACTDPSHPHDSLCIWSYYPHPADEETEGQSGPTDCPSAQS